MTARTVALLLLASCVAAERSQVSDQVEMDAKSHSIHVHTDFSALWANAQAASLSQTGCDKGPNTVKTVEIIVMVENPNQETFIMTKRNPDGKHMNMGGSFYMQCEKDDFHPDACGPDMSAACAPTLPELPTTFNGKPLEQGEASQLTWAAKKILDVVPQGFSSFIDFLEKKGVQQYNVPGDGEKTYHAYPVKLTDAGDGQLEKYMESKSFEKVPCNEIMSTVKDHDFDTALSGVVRDLKLQGCR